jgi:hypothetical protein
MMYHKCCSLCFNQHCVAELGLWLHESGVLGASPDGMVVKSPTLPHIHFQTTDAQVLNPDIIEVKCPYSMREVTVLQGALTGDARSFLGIILYI